MENSLKTSCPKTMLVFRLVSFIFLLVLVIFDLATDQEYALLFMTFYGIFLTCVLFGLILLHYKVEKVVRFLEESIAPMWVLNCLITAYFWVLLTGELEGDNTIELLFSIFNHSIPFIANTIEILANQVVVKKIHILYGYLVFLGYILFINLPFTLIEEEIYEGLNYTNLFTYVGAIGVTIFFVASGFALYFAKKKTLEKKKQG